MRTYAKLESAFWQNPKIKKLSDPAKLLLIYIFSCPHGNSIGCYPLPQGYIVADMGWNIEHVAERVSELVTKGFIERDEDTSLTKIVGWFDHNTIENDNVAKAAIKTIRALPICQVKARLLSDLEDINNKFLNKHLNGLPNPLRNVFRNPEPEPEPEPTATQLGAREEISFFQKVYDYATAAFPGLVPANTSLIHVWQQAGYDFEKHIKPALDSAKAKGKTPRSFGFFSPAIEDSAKAKMATAPKTAAKIVLTEAEKEKNRKWYLKMGRQHPEYNPEGISQ